MKAMVFYGKEDIRWEAVPKPECGAGDLLVKVEACAVCGTDMKAFYHGNPRIKPPRVMGHEFAGLVEDVGADAKGFQVGDRVVMATSISCGECVYCQKGLFNLCLDLKPMGFAFDGGMAEYVRIPELAVRRGHVIKVPQTLKAELAAIAEPLSCAANSVENTGVQKGDTVLIMGAGPLGILNLCAARAIGAERIILSEVSENRLKQAETFGCDRLVNSMTENLEEIVMAMTDGLGADAVIVTAPAAPPQEQALKLVRKQGSVCLFASLPAGNSMLNIDSRLIHYGEIKLVGTSDSRPEHVQKAVAMLGSGSFPADKIASHFLPMSDIHQAFQLMKSGEALRVVLQPC